MVDILVSLYSQPKAMQEFSENYHEKLPIDLHQAWSLFLKTCIGRDADGFGVPFQRVCMERAQVLFFSKISEIFGIEINSLMFLMQDLLSPKRGVCSSGKLR